MMETSLEFSNICIELTLFPHLSAAAAAAHHIKL